jgi:hypothetical protein
MNKTPRCLYSIRHFFKPAGNILRDSRHSGHPQEVAIMGEYVRLTDTTTGKTLVVDNLDSHGWYSHWGTGRTSFLSRYSPMDDLGQCLRKATHWSEGRFGTLSKIQLHKR